MGKTFVRKQQEIINEDMRTMPPEVVNEILGDMKPHEANEFLGRLGHARAAEVYSSYEGEGCLEMLSLRLCIALCSLAACLYSFLSSAS